MDSREENKAITYPSLNEVTSGGGSETGQECPRAFRGDHLSEGSKEAPVVLDGVELDSSLDDIQRSHGAVGERAANATSRGGLDKVHDAKLLLRGSVHLLSLSNHFLPFSDGLLHDIRL